MKAEFGLNGETIAVTTEHDGHSYNEPQLVIDGLLIEGVVDYEPDVCDCTILGLLADEAGIHNGQRTRRDLRSLADVMLPAEPRGAHYDMVIDEFLQRKIAEAESNTE